MVRGGREPRYRVRGRWRLQIKGLGGGLDTRQPAKPCREQLGGPLGQRGDRGCRRGSSGTMRSEPLKRDDFEMNRHRALALCRGMIFSENRFTLFRIMPW